MLLSLCLIACPPSTPLAYEKKAQEDSSRTPGGTESFGSLPKFLPNTNLVFSVPRITRAPRIDGKLDEPLWRGAAKLDNFVEVEPGDNVKPKVETETLFAYDNENIYIGFICYDNAPDKIRASVTDRDEIFNDDMIGIMLDTFNDQQNAYEFFVNPYGVQADLRRTLNNEDLSFDTVWESEGEINSIGWTAEVAIPFRSLRFPDSYEQEWRIHIIRVRPRDSREQISWAPISRDESCVFCQAGTLRGIKGVNTGKYLELLPFAITSQRGGLEDPYDPQSRFLNQNPKGDAGFGLKYGLTPNLTLDFTYNPDFSQVESDVAQIDINTTFAIFFPEKRPFFLEGSDIFRTEGRGKVIYTRSINDPAAAAKLTGKEGKYTVGYVFAVDDASPFVVPFEEQSEFALGGRSVSNILRLKRDLLSDSYVGFLFTDRHLSSGSNTVLGVDGNLRFRDNYRLTGRVIYTYTREPDDEDLSSHFANITFGSGNHSSFFDGESFSGFSLRAGLRREARHLNFSLHYNELSPTFRADNGFITSNNSRVGALRTELVFQPNNRFLELIEPGFNLGRKYNCDGVFKDAWAAPQLFIRFKKQTSLRMNYLWSKELFKGTFIEGIRRFEGNLGTNVSEVLSGGIYARIGRSIVRDVDPPILGHERTYQVWTMLKPTARFKLQLNYSFSKMLETASGPELFRGYIARSKLTYQLTKRFYLRLVTQYDNFKDHLEIDPLLSYKINAFTVFFLGSTHDLSDYGGSENYRERERQFFVKFQYLFRV